eukprot:m.40083 g.40083  ORF g.40083 m.40083 type:complete len:821 (+) comp11334_c0_seq1:285-2747(+)
MGDQERRGSKPDFMQEKTDPARKFSISHAKWYRPDFTDVDGLLGPAKRGAFLVRRAPGREKDYALSVQSGAKVCNVLLRETDVKNKKMYEIVPTNRYFEDIHDLVVHGQVKPFHFPKINEDSLTLDFDEAEKAADNYNIVAQLLLKAEKDDDGRVWVPTSKGSKKMKLPAQKWYRPNWTYTQCADAVRNEKAGAFSIRHVPRKTAHACIVQEGTRLFNLLLETVPRGKKTFTKLPNSHIHFESINDLVLYSTIRPFKLPEHLDENGSYKVVLNLQEAEVAHAKQKELVVYDSSIVNQDGYLYHLISKSAKKVDHTKQTWYKEDWDHSQCVEYLKTAPNGAFVIRKVGEKRPDDYALAVQAGVKVCNVLLPTREYKGKRFIGISPTKDYFEHMFDLVLYAHTVPFKFASLGSAKIVLILESAKEAEERFLRLQKFNDTADKSGDYNYHRESPLAKKTKLQEQFWYQPDWTHPMAQSALTHGNVGAFVIRKAPNRPEGDYAMSVQAGPKICNVLLPRIEYDGKTYNQIRPTPECFENVIDLVRYGSLVPFHFKGFEDANLTLDLGATEQLARKIGSVAEKSDKTVDELVKGIAEGTADFEYNEPEVVPEPAAEVEEVDEGEVTEMYDAVARIIAHWRTAKARRMWNETLAAHRKQKSEARAVAIAAIKEKHLDLVELTEDALEIKEHIKFPPRQSVISADSHTLLNQVAEAIKIADYVKHIEIAGHTDDGQARNMARQRVFRMELSQKRADAVMNYLIARGADSKRLSARGYGGTRPLVPNDTEENKAINRRVEFLVDGGGLTAAKHEVKEFNEMLREEGVF